jgi:hypothetical protein
MTSNEVWKHIATGAAGTRQIARADPFIRAAARFTMDEIKPALLQPPGVIAIRARRM